MKIVSLNTWGGRAGKEGLLTFFESYKNSIDIFCLQEIWSAPYENLEGAQAGGKAIDHQEIMVYGLQEITALLPEHVPYFYPHHGNHYGLLMLVHKKIDVEKVGEVFVHKHKGYIPYGDVGLHARNIQFVTTRFKGEPLTIINFHGLWNGKGKTDSEDRLEQSKNILNFTQAINGEIIVCGDFNLLPDTESIKIIEESGLRNLIKEYGVSSTRTSYYTKSEKFADYIFVSNGVEVREFKVLLEEVSDHAPLYLEIS